jgi:hypothetical protein
MLPLQNDPIQVQLTVNAGQREKLTRLIQQNPDVFAQVRITTSAPPYPDKSIFINYRRDDSEDVCGRIYDRLIQEFGRGSVFKDVDDIPAGVDFRQVLEREVGSTDLMLVLIGPDWDNRVNRGRLNDPNDFVRFEIETALRRGIPVIPVLVRRRTALPPKNDLPAPLQDLVFRNARPVRADPDFHKDMDWIVGEIRAVFDLPPAAPAEVIAEGVPTN